MLTEIIFDIETQKLFENIDSSDPADLGVSIVCLYKRQIDQDQNEISGQMYSFWPDDFDSMWPLFTNVDRIIGFNSKKFDAPALAPLSPFDFLSLNHFDLMDHVKQALGFRLSLNALARQCLNQSKTDVSTNAVIYWRQHTKKSLQKLKTYCQQDVYVTRDIYDYGLKNKQLKFKDKWNTIRSFPIDFSYPAPSPQTSLF